MATNTKIEWCDATWNALRGCDLQSPGCANCYARAMAARFTKPGQWGHGIAEMRDGKPRWTGNVVLDEKALLKPLHWKKPRRIFVTSIGDPGHPSVTDDMLDRLFAVMAVCYWHEFQLLTKRPERMQRYLSDPAVQKRVILTMQTMFGPGYPRHFYDDIRNYAENGEWPLPNVWLGVSVENQAAADERIPHLLSTPAAVRFLSCEPLLVPVNLNRIHEAYTDENGVRTDLWESCINGKRFDMWSDMETDGWPKVDWVIIGGESGPKARPMHPDWARSLRDQCAAVGVPFMFKQWGEWAPADFSSVMVAGRDVILWPDGATGAGHAKENGGPGAFMHRFGKHAAGRLLDGVEHNAFPEVP